MIGWPMHPSITTVNSRQDDTHKPIFSIVRYLSRDELKSHPTYDITDIVQFFYEYRLIEC